MASNLLVINNLNKFAGKFHILHNVSFAIPKGSVCAFIGPNGAGKTTTIKSIMGLYKYDHGDILVNGQSTKKYKVRRYIGYVPEKENFPKISGRHFMLDMADLHKVNKTLANKRINWYSRVFNFSDQLDRSLFKMSSGQKKKALIMQAFIHDPELIIADEPTENLDPDTREIFYRVINKLKKEKKTILISTHNLDEIVNYADYIVIIVGGKICYASPHKLGADLHRIYNKFKPKLLI